MSRLLKRKGADCMEELEERVRFLEAENAALRQQLIHSGKNETVMLDLGSIPEYLMHGEHYANLIKFDGAIDHESPNSSNKRDKMNGGNIISIPRKCFKVDTEIRPNVDLVHLLETLRYWMVDTLPDSVIEYALNTNTFGSFRCVAEEYWVDMPVLKILSNVAVKGLEKDISKQIICALEEHAPHEIIHYLFVHHDTDTKLREEVVIRAARLGSLDCLQYILGNDRCDNLDITICTAAAGGGHLDCLKYAHEHGCPWDSRACSEAAGGGHLDCLKYAHEHGCPWEEATCSMAADKGNLDCLKYAHEHGCPWEENTCSNAADKGNLDCLKYAHEHGCPWDEETCRSAAGCLGGEVYFLGHGGHLECLQYAHEQGCPWDENTCCWAAGAGKLDCLKYAHEHGCPWDKDTCRFAADQGHLDCLKYAHEHGCPWDEETCRRAAGRLGGEVYFFGRGGHLDCLKYAHEQGCPWDENACCWAAGAGNLDCLKYAHEHGCPWGEDTCNSAAGGGHLDCLQYAHEHGCVWDKNTCYKNAIDAGHDHCSGYVQQQDNP